jgi:acetyltransferase
MSVINLDKIFRPKSIAVVGASERPGSIGNALMRNLIERGFGGKIQPINPNHQEIWNLPACPSIGDLKSPHDLAVICTPMAQVPQVVEQCADGGISGAVIISAGGKEIGDEGKKAEASISQAARRPGMRVIGPNCVGIIANRSRLNASFANQMPLAGKMAFVSQSGAICTAILDLSVSENIGFSYFVSLGSMLDVDFGEMRFFPHSGVGAIRSICWVMPPLSFFAKSSRSVWRQRRLRAC